MGARTTGLPHRPTAPSAPPARDSACQCSTNGSESHPAQLATGGRQPGQLRSQATVSHGDKQRGAVCLSTTSLFCPSQHQLLFTALGGNRESVSRSPIPIRSGPCCLVLQLCLSREQPPANSCVVSHAHRAQLQSASRRPQLLLQSAIQRQPAVPSPHCAVLALSPCCFMW